MAGLLLPLDDRLHFFLVDDLRLLFSKIDIGGGVGSRGRDGRAEGGESRALSPNQFDQLVLKVPAGRDDIVEIVGPNNEYTFVALMDRVQTTNGVQNCQSRRTMKAPHCSLSARGSQAIVSRI